MEFVLFIIGLVMLIKAADFFVDSSTKIAATFKVPEVVIGATIVALGTTLPETLVSATGAYKGIGGIAYGNAIGSIICNTSLISALTLVFLPSKVNRKSLSLPTIFFFSAYIIYVFVAVTFKRFDRASGFILFCIFILYVVATILNAKYKSLENISEKKEEKDNPCNAVKEILIIVVSAILIAIGSNLLVENGTKIAKMMHVPDSVIAVTMVALGTSLPELMTAITAIRKKHSELSIGNIIGANFFNLVSVTGIAAMVGPFNVPVEKTIFGLNASYVVDIPLVLIVMLILCLPPLIKSKTYRYQGIVLLLIYTMYLIFQFLF